MNRSSPPPPGPAASPDPEASPQQPDQPPEDEAQTVVVGRPGWLPATSRPRPDSPAGTGTDGGSEPNGTPTPPATDRKIFAGKAKTFATITEAGLEAIGGLLNGFLGQGGDDQTFLPDDDDLNSIPPPAGRIIARRMKVSEDANLSDAADMLTAAIGLAAWLAKGLIGLAQARLAKRHPPAAPPGAVPGEVIPADGQAAQ